MANLVKIARRTFLVGSAAIAGGVAFGYYQYAKPLHNPLEDDLADGDAALTPFVLVTREGVTLITPRADKGQGAYSLQAHLLAEELDVDPLKVMLSPGPPSPTYYNGAVLDEAAPGMGDFLGKMTGMQITGGSSTVPDMFDKMRQAGAVARETLKKAASRRLGIPRGDLKTEDGYVIAPDGARLSYGELAAEVAKLSLVTSIKLRDPSQWRYLGKRVQRTDILAKSTGAPIYGIDMDMPDMVYATVRANPAFGSALTSFDDSAAKSMRGVKKIVSVRNGVAVVADNTWRAFKAADAIDCVWAKPDWPSNTEGMWKALEENFQSASLNIQPRKDGDVDAALADGDIIEAEYRAPYLAHAPLEPATVVVRYSGDGLYIATGTQIPGFIENHAMALTGLPRDQVTVDVLPMGGSFGRRLEDEYVIQAIQIAMEIPDVPIKMTWTREEEFGHDPARPMALARARGQVRDGKVDAIDIGACSQSIGVSQFGRLMGSPPPGPDATLATGLGDQPFSVPHFRASGYAAPEMAPVSSWRSVGCSQNGFFHESFMDELIHAAGSDPLEERLRLCNEPIARSVLETVGEMSGWNGPSMGEGRGRGIAFVRSFGVPVAEVVEVTNTADGIRIDKVYVACDVGRILDPVNFEAQVTGGAIFGLGHAMNCELTFSDHAVEQTNFHAYEAMRMYQTPKIEIKGLENADKIRGIGEPAVPPAAPALANAIFAATGQRLREMPFNKHIRFV